jgi:hypothetical protein
MKRTSLHLDDRDLKALERIAREHTRQAGSNVSVSALVRRLIRDYVQNWPGKGGPRRGRKALR